jgi:flagellin-like hook-associated protein FlgL
VGKLEQDVAFYKSKGGHMSVSSISTAISQTARSYQTSQKDLASALARLGSGRRFQSATEDVTSFIRAAGLSSSRDKFENIRDSAIGADAAVKATTEWAQEMRGLLVDLKNDTGGASAIAAVQAAASSATYGGDAMNISAAKTWATLRLADNSTVDIAATNPTTALVPTAATTDLDSEAEIDASIARIDTYISDLASYGSAIEMTQNYASAMVVNMQSAESTLTAIDEAAESLKFTEADIRQQSSIAMIAQGNLAQKSILYLFR